MSDLRFAGALALTGVLALVRPAAADTIPAAQMEAAFEAMCVATNGNREAALAVADRLGWTEDDAPTRYDALALEARRGDRSSRQLLLLTEDSRTRHGMPVTSRGCIVMAAVDDPGAVIAYAEQMVAGIRPVESDADGRHWVYGLVDGRPTELRSEAQSMAAYRHREIRELLVSDGQSNGRAGNTALQYSVGYAR